MANRRELKRYINSICDELLTDTIAASLYGTAAHEDDTEALLFAIVKTQRNYIGRVSSAEPGMPAKKYFKDLLEKFAAEASELADQISNI